ncbi:venom serine carboxypeptidase-like [Agrilus planipennis]|uniref:Carboxypeptidase n=1 Tax=Agrilus planipennis TaxID=224129 RepID=A0A7F5RHS0_AGRPL|nr:venom serine carboxypeptidase-like [Agrilus planipennis]
MSLFYFFILTIILFIVSGNCFINVYPKIKQENYIGDPGQPLILTPLIEQNKIAEAQNASQVHFNGFKNITSYAGYFTVNKQFNSNMFFWFFPSLNNYKEDPVILWLQGGPGATSIIGLFAENGPFAAKSKHGLKLRRYTWTSIHSVIYIDNPVGTGYSFTNGGYAKNETAVGNDLYEALVQFFKLFPELQKNKFFIAGESYAGKYVPAIGYTIHKNNPTAKIKINLSGLSIGNGLCDPENQIYYDDYLYQLGLIDLNSKSQLRKIEEQGVNYIKNKKWDLAFKTFDDLLNGDLSGHPSLFKNITGFDNYFNYLIANNTNNEITYMGRYIQRADVRAAIHVGNTTFNDEDKTVETNLVEDMMQSVAPWIIELLNHYQILFYNGQLDIIVAYPLTINFLQNLKFSGAEAYKTAKRHQWFVDGELAGYEKHAGNLTEVLVRNAGHMVPADQAKWALDLITRFTHHKV